MITEHLIDKIAVVIYKSAHNKEPLHDGDCDQYASAAVDIIDIMNDHLPDWPHSHSYLREINEDFAGCILDEQKQIMNEMGIPRGTFGDDQFKNLIVQYNYQRQLISVLQDMIDARSTDEMVIALNQQVKLLEHLLAEIANWPEHQNSYKEMRNAAASAIDPKLVKHLQILTE